MRYQPTTPFELFHYFLQPRAEHIHTAVVVKVASQRDVKPVALLAFDDKFVGVSNIGGVWRIASGSRER
jgi:hypothetical protein